MCGLVELATMSQTLLESCFGLCLAQTHHRFMSPNVGCFLLLLMNARPSQLVVDQLLPELSALRYLQVPID